MTDWQPSPHIQAIYDDYLASSASLGAERPIHYTEYWKSDAAKQTGPCVRNAGALAHHLEERTVRIYPGEVIVGSHTEHRIGAVCHIEKAGVFMLGDLFRFEKRPVNPLA
ncbi:MAG: pyruvate formate lyase family protein, partial [Actinomycetota bacterium]|nr:pyruvate formate lyase family protein [Actinomycetota bacterium]